MAGDVTVDIGPSSLSLRAEQALPVIGTGTDIGPTWLVVCCSLFDSAVWMLTGKGGKNRRRGKNENEDEKRELVFKEDGQGQMWFCAIVDIIIIFKRLTLR